MALYSLLSKVHATQARFFLVVLQHILQAGQDQEDLAGMEADANDPSKSPLSLSLSLCKYL